MAHAPVANVPALQAFQGQPALSPTAAVSHPAVRVVLAIRSLTNVNVPEVLLAQRAWKRFRVVRRIATIKASA